MRRSHAALLMAGLGTALIAGPLAVPAEAAAVGNSCGTAYDPKKANYPYVVDYKVGVGNDRHATITMKAGWVNNRKVVWGKIESAQIGDGVSLRWSDNGGTSYWNCGRPANKGYATISSGGDQYTLAVPVTSAQRAFKVCGRDKSANKVTCTTQWVRFG